MACYRAAIGGVARSGGNRNWGKLDWLLKKKTGVGLSRVCFGCHIGLNGKGNIGSGAPVDVS